MSSQLYALFEANEVKGPFSRQQIDRMIQQGQIARETLCAPIGSTEWEPLENLFPNSTTQENGGRAEERSQRLDPEVRKRIIQLGFADAATVDLMTPAQARAALKAHDDGLAKEKKNQKIALLLGFPAAFAVGLAFVMTPLGAGFNNWVAKKFVEPKPEYLRMKSITAQELAAVRKAAQTLEETQLKAPTGRPAKAHFESRVHIPTHATNEFVFSIEKNDFAKFATGEPKLVYLKTLPPKIIIAMDEHTGIVWKYLHPETLSESLNAAELAASWELFKQQNGTEIAAFVEENKQSEAVPLKDGEFAIQGARPEYVVAILEIRGLKIYLPTRSQEHLTITDPRRHTISRAEALENEVYTVTEKQASGGRAYGLRAHFHGKDYYLKKMTPVNYYIGVAREETDRAPTWLSVSEEVFDKIENDAKIPTTKLYDYTVFDSPQAASIVAPLEFIQET